MGRLPGPVQVPTNGIELSVVVEGEGYPVVLLHGFPELAYSWRFQVPALAEAGFRVIAPDLRGYGGSDKPPDTEAYRLSALVADVLGVLDALEGERAVVVGHDWGSIIGWNLALAHADRVERLVSLNVPYRGHPGGFPNTTYIREHLADRFGYVLFFQEPGPAEAWFAQDLALRLRTIYQGVAADPSFMGDDEFAVYLNAFRAGGMTGPLNYYRNIDANWAATEASAGSPVRVPALMVTADSDPVLPASLAEGMDRWVSELRVEHIRRCGHWTQQERPGPVNEVLLDYLGDLR